MMKRLFILLLFNFGIRNASPGPGLRVIQRSGETVTLQCETDYGREILWDESIPADSYSENGGFVTATRNFTVTEPTTVLCTGVGIEYPLLTPVVYNITLYPREVTETPDPSATASTTASTDTEDTVPSPVEVYLESGRGLVLRNKTVLSLSLQAQVSISSNISDIQFCAKARYPTGGENATDISCTCSSVYHEENLNQTVTVHSNCTLDPSMLDICMHNLTVQLSAENERWSSTLSNPIVVPVDHCPEMNTLPPPVSTQCGLGCIIGLAVCGVVVTVVTVVVLTLCYRKCEARVKPKEQSILPLTVEQAETNGARPEASCTTPLLRESSFTFANAVLSGATPPKLPPHVQQQPLREEKETWQITDSAEESGDLSQDPALPTMCRSLEPPPHVKNPPVEEEETDAEEGSSAEKCTPPPTLPFPVMESSSDPMSAAPKQLEEHMAAYTNLLKNGAALLHQAEDRNEQSQAVSEEDGAASLHQAEDRNEQSQAVSEEDGDASLHQAEDRNEQSQAVSEEDGGPLLNSSSEFVNRNSAKRTQVHHFMQRNEGPHVSDSLEGRMAPVQNLFSSLGENHIHLDMELSSPPEQHSPVHEGQ